MRRIRAGDEQDAFINRRRSPYRILSISLISLALLLGACAGGGQASPSTRASLGPSAASSATSGASNPTIAPGALDGFIVFARAGGRYGDETLFAAGADGSHERQLTADGQSCCGRLSPDGTQVLYSYYPPEARRVTVAIQSLADGTVLEIPLPDDTANLGAGAWSPDGTHLALQLWDDADHSRDGIYTVRAADGSDLQRLTHAQVADIPADYSPDGTELIVFRETDVQSVGTLSILDIKSGQLTPLPLPGIQVGWGAARYSPDGATIVFQESRVSATGALWTIHPDGEGLMKIFEDTQGRFASHPAWSPDGSMLMFALNPVADDFRHLPNGTYVINADGSDLRLVLDEDDFRREFEWKAGPIPGS